MLLLFTPAGVQTLMNNFPDFAERGIAIGCFGPTTAKAIKEAGLHLDLQAGTAEVPSITAALESFIKEHNKD